MPEQVDEKKKGRAAQAKEKSKGRGLGDDGSKELQQSHRNACQGAKGMDGENKAIICGSHLSA